MLVRLQLKITGIVQGVGFRPFVYKLAKALKITGWICNDLDGVYVEVQSTKEQLDVFLIRLTQDIPQVARIDACNIRKITVIANELDFIINFNKQQTTTTAMITADLATCADCLVEIFAPDNRRYLYPFTNCTQCGPRFSIVRALPYERHNTSMHSFPMCKLCAAEYHDVQCRRFHAQPNACWDCGPKIELLTPKQRCLASQQDVFFLLAEAITQGKIIAIKGLGGFHLVADARNDEVIAKLRQRKHRYNKPFAIMVGNLVKAQQLCTINKTAKELLISQQAPIVLLPISNYNKIAANIAPNNPYLGVMLPYMPLQHILLQMLDFPLVVTSGNFSGEPICTAAAEAFSKLTNIADLFVMHNREIVNRVDDSVIKVIENKKIFIRRARGYSPYYQQTIKVRQPILAVGAHNKNTIAIAQADNMLLSQHIGDLDLLEATQAFQNTIMQFATIYQGKAQNLVCDLHPEYFPTKYAVAQQSKHIMVQHHHAHIAAVMLEKQLTEQVLGIVWDGSGFGLDATIWGGEFLVATFEDFTRVAHLEPFALPGGEMAIKEPQRIAVSLLSKLTDKVIADYNHLTVIQGFKKLDLQLLLKMIKGKINTPMTSSMGRLFDGIAAILGLPGIVEFEGQAAMALEFLAETSNSTISYDFIVQQNQENMLIIDWQRILQQILVDLNKLTVNIIAKKFHNTLIDLMLVIAKKIGLTKVVLTGGCFQNKILLAGAISKLTAHNFSVYWPEEIPINDGGIAFGQLAIANAKLRN